MSSYVKEWLLIEWTNKRKAACGQLLVLRSFEYQCLIVWQVWSAIEGGYINDIEKLAWRFDQVGTCSMSPSLPFTLYAHRISPRDSSAFTSINFVTALDGKWWVEQDHKNSKPLRKLAREYRKYSILTVCRGWEKKNKVEATLNHEQQLPDGTFYVHLHRVSNCRSCAFPPLFRASVNCIHAYNVAINNEAVAFGDHCWRQLEKIYPPNKQMREAHFRRWLDTCACE